MTTETVTLAGGCFWCLEAVYDQMKGVTDVVSGYANGGAPNPTYEAVCSGRTGYAEAVQIKYNPEEASFADLLRVFFTIHDPTTLNRQGADVGTQYRSGIYTHTPEQEAVARQVIDEIKAEGLYRDPIVTELEPLKNWYPAEDYHQEYYAHNPNAGYCRVVVAPKVAKFRQKFFSRVKA